MAVELDHSFSTSKSTDDSFATITDLERVIPLVEGGRVIEATGPDSVKAEIDVKMGAMSMKFAGTVEVAEKDAAAHTDLMKVKAKEAGGDGHANADVSFELDDGGGTIHTSAQIDNFLLGTSQSRKSPSAASATGVPEPKARVGELPSKGRK